MRRATIRQLTNYKKKLPDMRKITMPHPASTSRQHLSIKSQKGRRELDMQIMLNAELLRICEHQQRIIDEQSQMIAEILDQMGR